MTQCYCQSGLTYSTCCQPYLESDGKPDTAEALLRARYSAFVTGNVDFIEQSVHPDKKDEFDRESAESWSSESKWLGLEVEAVKGGAADDDTGTVNFTARYSREGQEVEHAETAQFTKHDGDWYFFDGYLDGREPYVRETPKVGRNEPCPCGSGKKFKKCCANK